MGLLFTYSRRGMYSQAFFLSFFLFIKHNWKIIPCMQILNIPNGCSAAQDFSYLLSASCELLLASYGLKTASKALRVLGRWLLELLFTYSGHGTYSWATPRLLNVCVTGGGEMRGNELYLKGSSETPKKSRKWGRELTVNFILNMDVPVRRTETR